MGRGRPGNEALRNTPCTKIYSDLLKITEVLIRSCETQINSLHLLSHTHTTVIHTPYCWGLSKVGGHCPPTFESGGAQAPPAPPSSPPLQRALNTVAICI